MIPTVVIVGCLLVAFIFYRRQVKEAEAQMIAKHRVMMGESWPPVPGPFPKAPNPPSKRGQ